MSYYRTIRRCLSEERAKQIAKEEITIRLRKMEYWVSRITNLPFFTTGCYLLAYYSAPANFLAVLWGILGYEVVIMCIMGGYKWQKKKRLKQVMW